jgi:hypothetical protein
VLTPATTKAAAVMARTLLRALTTSCLGPSLLCCVLIRCSWLALTNNSKSKDLESRLFFLGTCCEKGVVSFTCCVHLALRDRQPIASPASVVVATPGRRWCPRCAKIARRDHPRPSGATSPRSHSWPPGSPAWRPQLLGYAEAPLRRPGALRLTPIKELPSTQRHRGCTSRACGDSSAAKSAGP